VVVDQLEEATWEDNATKMEDKAMLMGANASYIIKFLMLS